jgi:hypothetical protein
VIVGSPEALRVERSEGTDCLNVWFLFCLNVWFFKSRNVWKSFTLVSDFFNVLYHVAAENWCVKCLVFWAFVWHLSGKCLEKTRHYQIEASRVIGSQRFAVSIRSIISNCIKFY